MFQSRVRLSTLCLVTLAMFDLLSTLLFFNLGFGESNLVFRSLYEHFGIEAFIVGKLVFTIGPILILEHVRKSHPRTAEVGTWVAFGSYFLLYASHLASLR